MQNYAGAFLCCPHKLGQFIHLVIAVAFGTVHLGSCYAYKRVKGIPQRVA